VLTVEQLCKMFCLSPELCAALKRCRLAPREVRIGERVPIPLEYAAKWCVEAEGLRLFAQPYLCERRG
jgi:hypothetical protein